MRLSILSKLIKFLYTHLRWLVWLKFSKCDILSFLMAKLLLILNTDAYVYKKNFINNNIYRKCFFHPFHHENIFLKKSLVKFTFTDGKNSCFIYRSTSYFEVEMSISQSRVTFSELDV